MGMSQCSRCYEAPEVTDTLILHSGKQMELDRLAKAMLGAQAKPG